MVISITAVPLVVSGRGLGGLQGRMAVRSAQSQFLSLHDLSRSMAVERGMPVGFVADSRTQTVTVREGCDGDGRIIESRDFNLSYRVDILTSGQALEICMTARGYADPGSNSFTDLGRVTFLRGQNAASVVLFPLGQAMQE